YGDTPPDVKWSVQLTAPQLVDLFDHEWDERIKEPALHRLGVWSSLLCPGGARQVCGQPSLLWHRCPFRCPGCMLASGALCVSDHRGKGMGRDACGVIQRRSGGLREARTHSIPSCDGMCHCQQSVIPKMSPTTCVTVAAMALLAPAPGVTLDALASS